MLIETVKRILYKDERLINNDEFNMIKLYDLLEKYDSEILKKLYQNDEIKNKFFKDIDGINIFKQEEFKFFLHHQKPFENGWTKLKNRIGLCDGKYFLRDTQDIVLNFPFKDCILEGGQSNSEGIENYFNYEVTSFKEKEKAEEIEMIGKKIEIETSSRGKETYFVSGFKKYKKKRKEIFFNEILAKDEIDRLLEKKAFVDWRRYTKNGEEKIEKIKKDKNGIIRENLIIKGNNLLALHSLKKEFTGKIKLIYIDPPYNTGNDTFAYNDNFNHSTWLTFMKNRLEIAKELLREDGSIFVQCDDNEDSYLKVLLDEIFGRDNYRNKITWKRRGGSANPKNRLNNVTDYILWYSKSENMKYTPILSLDDEKTQQYIKERFTNIDENGRKFMKSPIQSPNLRENLKYEYKGYKVPAKGWSISKELMEKWDAEGKLCFPELKTQNINRKIYLDEYKGQPISSLWTDIYVINPMSKESIDFTGQKPEALLKRIFEMCTEEGDIVLDYHLGTGTTCAVAHKLNRQYIGIEQMDYIEELSIDRLKKIISGDPNGISKDVGWQGGGEFLYFELAKFNEEAKSKILNCETSESLENLFEILYNKYYLNYNLNIKKFQNLIEQEEFKSLSLDDKKRIYISMLDANSMYVNYEDMEDIKFNLSKDDIKLTKEFYGVK
ncbi:MAG: DNA methyltransferase [Clostridium sp.]